MRAFTSNKICAICRGNNGIDVETTGLFRELAVSRIIFTPTCQVHILLRPSATESEVNLKKLILVALLGTTPVSAADAGQNTYTYMCKVLSDHKLQPVTVHEVVDEKGDTVGGTITWLGTVFHNLKQVPGCRAMFVATKDGKTAALCTATQGVADLQIGKGVLNDDPNADDPIKWKGTPQSFECQMMNENDGTGARNEFIKEFKRWNRSNAR